MEHSDGHRLGLRIGRGLFLSVIYDMPWTATELVSIEEWEMGVMVILRAPQISDADTRSPKGDAISPDEGRVHVGGACSGRSVASCESERVASRRKYHERHTYTLSRS